MAQCVGLSDTVVHWSQNWCTGARRGGKALSAAVVEVELNRDAQIKQAEHFLRRQKPSKLSTSCGGNLGGVDGSEAGLSKFLVLFFV